MNNNLPEICEGMLMAAAGTCTLWSPFWSAASLLSNKRGYNIRATADEVVTLQEQFKIMLL